MRKEEGGRALLYNSDTGALTSINYFGLIIWRYLKEQPRTQTDIVAHLECVSDNVPLERAEADVENYLKNLQDNGFIGEVLDAFSGTQFKDPKGVEAENGIEDEKLTDPGPVDTQEGWPVRPDGRIFPYRGSSMRGTFKAGDFLEAKKCRPKNLWRGDVIVFRGCQVDHKTDLIVHRIIRIGKDGFVTQGDNSRIPDARPVLPSQIIGKAILYERAGKHRRVIGGWPGLIKAKTGYYFRTAISRIYAKTKRLWPTRLAGRILRTLSKSPVRTIRISTKQGPIVKWVWRSRTIACRHGDQAVRTTSFLARYLIDTKDIIPGS